MLYVPLTNRSQLGELTEVDVLRWHHPSTGEGMNKSVRTAKYSYIHVCT